MSDGIFLKLSEEWKLLWEGLWGDDDEPEKELLPAPEFLTKEKIKQLKREFSKYRQTLNRELEKINKELEQVNATIEALKVVGGDIEEAEKKIGTLNEKGQELTHQLTRLNKKINWVRSHEKKNLSDLPMN